MSSVVIGDAFTPRTHATEMREALAEIASYVPYEPWDRDDQYAINRIARAALAAVSAPAGESEPHVHRFVDKGLLWEPSLQVCACGETRPAAVPGENDRDEARARAASILSTTIATEAGRTFPTRAEFRRCLAFLAELSGDPTWDFLRAAAVADEETPRPADCPSCGAPDGYPPAGPCDDAFHASSGGRA